MSEEKLTEQEKATVRLCARLCDLEAGLQLIVQTAKEVITASEELREELKGEGDEALYECSMSDCLWTAPRSDYEPATDRCPRRGGGLL